ncbi:CLUMA_CG016469, isoform A [Clunio marinus]|uniref:CLUMA_CG016469, isoform A n=1 Tax=Clunio marinus TaxID=568069 RepID=A0A1J1ITX3_9DIPT|nr:CLUMA_CG016469, isoform A [Clunio marinus]
MVVSKRKKDVKEPASAPPEIKRTKIQAQRKFAQGQQPPSSAYLTYNLTSGSETPVKEKSQERELLPNLRPNTEDFLTFLCYRGTNALPKECDFQNTLNRPSTSGTTAKGNKSGSDKKNKDIKKKSPIKKQENATVVKESQISKPSTSQEKDPKTGFMPFAVRKRAEIHPLKNDKKKLQLMTKKRKEQKQDLDSTSESLNGPRTTRANNTNDVSVNKNTKKLKDTSQDSSFSEPVKVDSPHNSTLNNESNKEEETKKNAEKRQTRLSAIKNPPQSTSTPKESLKKEESEESISSSEDDEPLIKSEPKNKKLKLQESKSNADLMKSFCSDVNKSSLTNHNNSSQNDSKQSVVKSNRGRKKKIVIEKSKEKSPESEKSPEIKKVVRKKKTNVDQEIANSQANTTDLSENEARGRPMRKTKEAATIYMELIGRKLTLRDSSDNDSSLDSLEVPNLKRVELLENELKANCEKKAKEAEAEAEQKRKTDAKNLKGKRGMKKLLEGEDEEVLEEVKKIKEEKVLEKSFSDSDEEPLATKLTKQSSEKPPEKPAPKKRGRKSNQELAEIAARKENERKEAEQIKSPPKKCESKKNSLNQSPSAKLSISEKKINEKQVKNNASELSRQEKQSAENTHNRQTEKPKILQTDDDEFVKGFDSAGAKPMASVKSSINLLPSKEESEKIFGIASVTLAQSCGPLDTKCTLGKCGSVHVHKPPLAPPVLTESALGASLSPKDRRKSKVNMSREQIQKWLEEASWTPIPDDEMETVDIKTTSKASTSSIGHSKSGDDSQSSSLIREKNVVQQSPSTSGKTEQQSKQQKESSLITTKFLAKVDEKIKSNFPLKNEESKKQQPQPSNSVKGNQQKANGSKMSEKAVKSPSSSVAEKKTPIYQQQQQQQQQTQKRRTPVYKTDNKVNSKLTPMLPKSFGAFSPENEHSIYSFDREDDDLPTPATPFRRSNSKTESDAFNKLALTPNKQMSQQQQQSQVSLTLSPDENRKSAAISVGGDEVKKENEKVENKERDGENDSDSEGHTFYIPLQASNVSGSKTIQGVAVKLGTEGAEGPNQRIIMHAKLVTKSRANTTPLPESVNNVQELVKSLMANKETTTTSSTTTTKPVPCATVQPRFKSNDTEPEPSTSSLVATTKTKQTPKLGNLTEAPVFRPTEKEFQDPIEYIERITPMASRFGICRIIPPESFKPECRVSDEMRFTAYDQYVHKMLHRWGPSAKEFSAIKKYLATQSIVFQRPPLIAGIEVDLPRLYHTVQELGGLKEVIEKKKWAKVAEDMCIPKTAHDRVTKLDDIYCKYLLPYDTLSHSERQKLFDEVEADWAKREAKARRNADKGIDSDEQSNEESEESDEEDEDDNASMECMIKGRSMALSQFYRVARNMVTLWFKTPEPSVSEIESEYWRHVAVRDSHVCVHYGSIDSSGYGYGFPVPGSKTKMSPCSKHPWNLKVLTNNCGSILRSLGPVMGVTVPTLHVGMLFSAVCWYRDPTGLPWIEYLHTGASKIWYAVPDNQSSNFRTALTSLVPSHCQNKTIWLPCDTAMVPPYMLTDRNVSLCRTEQQPGQFVIVFPRAYTSSVCTGYTVSESVYFATNSWLNTAHLDFKDIQESCEPTMFSLEQLLFAIANDQRSKEETIVKVLPMLSEVYDSEKKNRQALKDAGVTKTEKIHETKNKVNAEELECNYCRANLHISWIEHYDDDDETVYCLKHSLKYINNNRIQANNCKLMFTYTIEEIDKLIKKLKSKISSSEGEGQSSQNESQPQTKAQNKLNHDNSDDNGNQLQTIDSEDEEDILPKIYLATQSIVFQRPPLIAGIEVDLPRLYHTVQELGGLKEVIEKKKWAKVAEDMCIPKTAHDRVTKLDDIYCKYLLPYDTLSHSERQKLFDEVEADWAKREAKARRNADKGIDSDEQSNEESEESDEEDEDDNASMECMIKGRSMALSQFYRVARNMVTLWFKTPEPSVSEIESEYWRHVAVRDSHVCVHYGSIDSSGYGYGFPVPGSKTKMSPCSKHPWNLKVLTNNCGSILRSLGPVMGVTVPTLHVGMLFSAVCWYRDPTGLPWIEYLHTGASKIWYAVPDNQSSNFRTALTSLVPSHCQNKTIWLPCDTAMVPPYMLTDRNVSLCRTEQQPGQFVIVFPRAYTSSVCTGYTVSESVYFATNSWLNTAHLDFKDIQESCEPTMFSLEQLLFAIANDQRSKEETIVKVLPMLSEVYDSEKKNRQALKDAGVTKTEKIHETKNKVNAEELECNYCRANLHISWIEHYDDDDETVYCLKHSLKYINNNRIQANNCKLMFTYTIEEIDKLIKKLKSKISSSEGEGQSSQNESQPQTKAQNKLSQKRGSGKF